jgi:hypothetical protein
VFQKSATKVHLYRSIIYWNWSTSIISYDKYRRKCCVVCRQNVSAKYNYVVLFTLRVRYLLYPHPYAQWRGALLRWTFSFVLLSINIYLTVNSKINSKVIFIWVKYERRKRRTSSIEKIYCSINADHRVDCFATPYNFGCLRVIDRTWIRCYFDNSRIRLDCCNDTNLYKHIHSARFLYNKCDELHFKKQPINLPPWAAPSPRWSYRLPYWLVPRCQFCEFCCEDMIIDLFWIEKTMVVLCANCKISVESK